MRIEDFSFGRITIDGVAYVELIVLSTHEAIEALRNTSARTNAVLHVIC